ncbi:MAG: DUF4417 domain-containing protein [Erysipelotrichaceae bacterium]|nr:DUF4417 domain-containing protein [Erysipelotrichaceae bacterium]
MDKDKRDVFGAYLLNRTEWIGQYELPYVDCYLEAYPDYLAVYSEKHDYHKTLNTGVCYCVHDYKFDGNVKLKKVQQEDCSVDYIDNIYNAIITRNEFMLNYYKERFKGVKFVCAPDYSTYDNMPIHQQMTNIVKSRMVFLWLKYENDVIAIPCAGFGSKTSLEWCFDGIGQGSDLFISLKSAQKEIDSIKRNKEGIKALVDKVNPRSLIVYSTACNESTLNQLTYAVDNGVKIILPDTNLRNRHKIMRGENGNVI